MRPRTTKACLRALIVMGLGAALVASPGSVEAGKPKRNNNNYFKYTDESGVVHITNRPRGKRGDWKLGWSMPANRTNLAEIPRGPGGVGTAKLSLDSEKAHRYDAYIRGAAQPLPAARGLRPRRSSTPRAATTRAPSAGQGPWA